MGFLDKSRRIRSYILIFFIIFSLILSIGIKKNITSVIDETFSGLLSKIYDKYGISVSYESLSPSLLTSFYVKNIKLTDKNETLIAEINNVNIDYNIIDLLKKNFHSGIDSILLDGINLDLNCVIDIVQHFQQSSGSDSIDFEKIIGLIPSNLKLKNLNFKYNNKQIELVYFIKNISLLSKSNNKTLELNIDSVLNAYIPAIKNSIRCNLGVFGSVTSDFNNSNLKLSLTDIVSGDIKMKKLNFYASYVNNIIDIHTIQVIDPLSVGILYNIDTKDFSAQINTDNITIDSLLSSWIKNPLVERFKEARLTTNLKIISNFNDKNIKIESDLGINIPDSIISGGMNIVANISGDENKINITNLYVDSEKLMANADIDFQFDGYQLSGIVELPYFILPNGNSVSTEIYFSPLDKGFSGFSPQIFIGTHSLTAISFSVLPQSDSLDFSLEMFDYSHTEETVPGSITIDGSYLTSSKYLQSNISLNTLYLDSFTNFAAEILPEENQENIQNISKPLSPFVLSGDLYLSTDFESVSYNVPYLLLANSKEDNQVVMISLNGNELSIQLNQLSAAFGSFGMQLNGYIDKNPDTSDIFFELNVASSSIPYHITGSVMPQVCNIMGDYGSSIELRFNENDISGFIEINNLPVHFMDKSVIFSTYSELKYDKADGPKVNINRFETEIIDSSVPINPRLSMSGSATRYGMQLDSVTYTDFYSALQGQTGIMIDFNNGILEAASIDINLQNPLSQESLNVSGNISNPDSLIFTTENLMNDFYIDLQIQANEFCLDRFAKNQSDKNKLTGAIFASGTVSHPYVTLGLEKFSMYSGSSLIQASGNLLLEDRNLSLIEVNLSYGGIQFNNLEAQASLEDFSLDASCDFRMSASSKALRTPISISISNSIVPKGSFLPDTFTLTFSAENIEGSLMKKPFPMDISIFHSPEGTTILSSDNIGLSGFMSSDGILEINLDNRDFFAFKADGFITSDSANIQLYDLNLNLPKVHEYIDVDNLINFEQGILSGEAVITGSFSQPDINGNLLISLPVLELPFITPKKVSSDKIELNIVDNVINVPSILLKTKRGQRIELNSDIYLDNWSLDYIDANVKTVEKDLFPGHLLMGFLKIEGDVSVDLDLFFQNSILEISGDLFGENVKVSSGLNSFTNIMKQDDGKEAAETEEELDKEPGLLFKTDIDVTLGTHSSITFEPILRCICVPNTKLKVIMDQSAGDFGIDGELKLRSGDVAYLNRSFYIKSGNIKFNNDDFTNPLVTLVAETRERDDMGTPVKIILDVENQYLLDLQPHFRSEPARSENEIQRILGQIAVADSSNPADFLFAAGDYAFQSTIVRGIENKLRDLLNFDIFSLRTNFLQNTLSMGLSGKLSKENFSIGNFLDNSTVYIGKYLGSYLYLDAMLHVSFEHNRFSDLSSSGAVVFQPEFGLELEPPFKYMPNIRFNLAPDINALLKNNQFVPATSVTLSWGWTF